MGAAVPAHAQQWIEARSTQYSVFYQEANRQDVEKVRAWLDLAEQTMSQKYGVTRTGWQLSVYLHPAPTSRASVSTAAVTTNNTAKTAVLDYLAPSAIEWANGGTSSLGLPKNDDYHAKVIVHEYVTLGHQTVQQQASRGAGWSYYSAPSWFVQGLQEYDGLLHSTAANRSAAPDAIRRWAGANREGFACCQTLGDQQRIFVDDIYNGGLLFHTFLVSRFGDDIQRRLLLSAESTLYSALARETNSSVSELFSRFREWFQTFCATCSGAITLTTSATINASASAGSATVNWTASSPWTGSTSAEWLTWPLSSGGTGTWGRSLTWTANTGTSPRTATLTISGGGTSVTVTVVQSGTIP
jgi:hypothetical protein